MSKNIRRTVADALRPHKKLFKFVRDLYRKLYRFRDLRYRYGYMIDEKNKVAYLVNSKAACSSIKVSMYNDGDMPDNYSVHHRKDKRIRTFTQFADPSYFKFTYVRNPFQRLVSCYESKYHADTHKEGKKDLAFDSYLFGLMKKDRGFNAFLLGVLLIPNWLADAHFRSQYKMVYRFGKRTLDFVGNVETIGETYPDIQKKYGYAPLKIYNKSGYQDYRTYFSPKWVKLLYWKYKKDVETFGYHDAYVDLLEFSQKNAQSK